MHTVPCRKWQCELSSQASGSSLWLRMEARCSTVSSSTLLPLLSVSSFDKNTAAFCPDVATNIQPYLRKAMYTKAQSKATRKPFLFCVDNWNGIPDSEWYSPSSFQHLQLCEQQSSSIICRWYIKATAEGLQISYRKQCKQCLLEYSKIYPCGKPICQMKYLK